ncbi:hypothetical protein [Bordetella sp. FB-8]|uniref:hypothetical protein n=1 Tax=Bordetella sp. FB-8 TaxID=1159870 RepID=UPI0003686480|nr:hypothetical protein [Bordetella sp. FB-8]
MSFTDIAKRFADASPGTDTFKAFYKDAFQLMKADVDNAGLYFIVGIVAQSFVRNYEDQGLAPEFVNAAKAILVGYNAKVCQGLVSPPAERLRLIGEVASDYEWNVHDF